MRCSTTPRAAAARPTTPLKSLSDTLKASRPFPPELLGKRVDYSALVIVVGRTCACTSAPSEEDASSYSSRSFYHRLEQRGHCTTIKQAKELWSSRTRWFGTSSKSHQGPPHPAERAPPCTLAFRPSSRCWWKARPSRSTRWSARPSTRISTATRWPSTFRSLLKRRSSVTLMLAQQYPFAGARRPHRRPTQDMVLDAITDQGASGGPRRGRTFASTDDVLIALEMGKSRRSPHQLRYTGRSSTWCTPSTTRTLHTSDEFVKHTWKPPSGA